MVKKKKDTGIIPELGITESKRDELQKRDWTHAPEPVKRFNADMATTQELVDARWSGIRVNHLNGMTEIWAAGRMLADEKTDKIAANPSYLANLHERAFSTNGTIVDVGATRDKPQPPFNKKH